MDTSETIARCLHRSARDAAWARYVAAHLEEQHAYRLRSVARFRLAQAKCRDAWLDYERTWQLPQTPARAPRGWDVVEA